MHEFVKRVQRKGLKLNKEKCEIRRTNVGHLLAAKGQGNSHNSRTAKQRRCEMPSRICTITKPAPAQLVHRCDVSCIISLGRQQKEFWQNQATSASTEVL